MDKTKKIPAILLGTVGLLICHLCGAAQFTAIKQGGFLQSVLLVCVPYLLKDIISVVLAFGLAAVIRSRVNIRKKAEA